MSLPRTREILESGAKVSIATKIERLELPDPSVDKAERSRDLPDLTIRFDSEQIF